MSELTQSLQIAVTRYPGTMAELARRTAIDRSTLYKIINGQRTPRQEQLERLAEALALNDEQKDTLLLQYKQRGRSTDPRIRTELHKLLTTACTVQESIRHEGVAPNTAFSEISCTDRYVEGPRAVGALAGALIARHLASGDTRPLLLSPFTNPVLDNALIERFSVADGDPVTVAQLLLFAQDREIPRHLASDIATLTHTLPLLFLPKMRYDARIAPCITGEPIPGALMPVYLLLPESALLMDRLGQKALLITDRKAVESLRLSFSRQYFDTSSTLRLTSDKHDFLESMALYSGLFARRKRCSMIRYQPPFTLFADKGWHCRSCALTMTCGSRCPRCSTIWQAGTSRHRTSFSVRRASCSSCAMACCLTCPRHSTTRPRPRCAAGCCSGCGRPLQPTGRRCASWIPPNCPSPPP